MKSDNIRIIKKFDREVVDYHIEYMRHGKFYYPNPAIFIISKLPNEEIHIKSIIVKLVNCDFDTFIKKNINKLIEDVKKVRSVIAVGYMFNAVHPNHLKEMKSECIDFQCYVFFNMFFKDKETLPYFRMFELILYSGRQDDLKKIKIKEHLEFDNIVDKLKRNMGFINPFYL